MPALIETREAAIGPAGTPEPDVGPAVTAGVSAGPARSIEVDIGPGGTAVPGVGPARTAEANAGRVPDAREHQAAGSVRRAGRTRPDLLLIKAGRPGCPDEVRRVLRESDCVREVAVQAGACRVLAAPGTAPLVAAALRAQGLRLAVVIVQWRHLPTTSPTQEAAPASATAAARSGHPWPVGCSALVV
ncbi:hypothetical protein ACFFWE_02635 [Sphaerisporangium melleum]